MRTSVPLIALIGSLALTTPAAAEAPPSPAPPGLGTPAPGRAPQPDAPGFQPRRRMDERRMAGPLTFMLRHQADLGLSPEQVERLQQLRLDFRREAIRQVAELRTAELELGELRRADQADLAVVEAKLRDIERRRTELRLAAIRTIQEGKAQLTADQRAKLRELFSQRWHFRPGGAPAPSGGTGPAPVAPKT
jgi:Spy/CpxP family protein refolding chaperone